MNSQEIFVMLQVRLLLLAALSGEHILYLGPPGTAKSELGRRLACLYDGPFFERLLTRFSVPEVPHNIPKLYKQHCLSLLLLLQDCLAANLVTCGHWIHAKTTNCARM